MVKDTTYIRAGLLLALLFLFASSALAQSASVTIEVPSSKVYVGDEIEVRSTPLFKKITVDSKGPVISGFSPTHLTVTKATTVFWAGTITDADATLTTVAGGAKPSSTAVAFTVTKAGSNLDGGVVYGATTFTKSTTKTSTVTSAWTFSAGLLMGAGTHTFSIVATDSAGNSTTSDADAVTAGNQAFSLEVDTTIPSLSAAKTGQRWDAATGLVKTDAAARDWIHLQFNGDKIDASTLTAADILIGNPGVVCGTGDKFAISTPEIDCDIVDMEAYAIAKTCLKQEIDFRSFKYISDSADEKRGTREQINEIVIVCAKQWIDKIQNKYPFLQNMKKKMGPMFVLIF